MKILKIILLLLSCSLICSCSSTITFSPLNPDNLKEVSATNPEDIEIFFTKTPDYKYVELGIISFHSGNLVRDEAQVYRDMRIKASEIGANAIITMQTLTDVTQAGAVNYDFWGNPTISERNIVRYKYQAMAIRKAE